MEFQEKCARFYLFKKKFYTKLTLGGYYYVEAEHVQLLREIDEVFQASGNL